MCSDSFCLDLLCWFFILGIQRFVLFVKKNVLECFGFLFHFFVDFVWFCVENTTGDWCSVARPGKSGVTTQSVRRRNGHSKWNEAVVFLCMFFCLDFLCLGMSSNVKHVKCKLGFRVRSMGFLPTFTSLQRVLCLDAFADPEQCWWNQVAWGSSTDCRTLGQTTQSYSGFVMLQRLRGGKESYQSNPSCSKGKIISDSIVLACFGKLI